ncbi:DUF6789 family protein [Natronococcus wangiae]|uniref:DUF6789 family protein n=1 Tax=Natronococcus wangiae TaxID=3068275 RepID=UPI00273D9E74|nr:DUF6789 family protein [Natronococcus sp. AD5]
MATADRIERRVSTREPERALPPSFVLYRATIRGITGGLIATAIMTLYRLPIFSALPPTAEFWARFVGGGEPERYPLHGLVLHFLYGAVAGGVFGTLFAIVDRQTYLDRERLGLLSGLAYGLVLSAVGHRIIFRYLLDRELADDEALVFHVGHAIYGLTLGTWFGTHERFGDVYD